MDGRGFLGATKLPQRALTKIVAVRTGTSRDNAVRKPPEYLATPEVDDIIAHGRARITPEEIGWFAGIVDGEGCVYIKRRKRGVNKTGWYHSLCMAVGNCDPRVVNKCREIATKVAGRRITSISLHRDNKTTFMHWSWNCCGDIAYVLLSVIRPFLVSKQAQADLGIELHKRVRQPRALLVARPNKGTFHGYLSDDEIGERERLAQLVMRLNAGGKAREENFAHIAADR